MVEVWIGSEKADYEGEIECQYSVTDFREIGSGNLNTSYDIDLPNTDNNRRLLKYISELSVTDEQSTTSRIIVNDIEIIRGKLVIVNTGEVYTKVIIKSDAWLEAYKNISITNLDLSAYNKTYDSTNVVASWTASSGEFMVFPKVYWGRLDFYNVFPTTSHQASDFVPWFNVYKIIEKIFSGYYISSTFMISSYFQSLYVSAKEPVKELSFLDDMLTSVAVVNDDNYTTKVYPDTENDDIELTSSPVVFNTTTTLGRYDEANDWYLVPEDGTYRFRFTYEVIGDYGGMTLNSSSFLIAIKKNTGGIKSTLVSTTGAANTALGTIDTGYVHLVSGDKIYCYANMAMNITNNLGETGYARIDIKDTSSFVSVDSTRCLFPGLGITITPSSWLQDVKQIDFINSIKKMFNLMIWLDSWNKTITIEPASTFFTSNVKDISTLIDYTDVQQELISQNYTSTIRLAYKNDENDYFLSIYNKTNSTQSGEKIVTLASAFAEKGETIDEVLFSTFIKQVPGDGRGVDLVPAIFKILNPQTEPTERPDSFNMKIGEWKGYVASGGLWYYEGSLLSDYPRIDAIDRATIYATYYAKTFHLIDTGKIVTLEGIADTLFIQELNTFIKSGANEGFRCLFKFLYQNEYHFGLLNRYVTNGIRCKYELTLII